MLITCFLLYDSSCLEYLFPLTLAIQILPILQGFTEKMNWVSCSVIRVSKREEWSGRKGGGGVVHVVRGERTRGIPDSMNTNMMFVKDHGMFKK